MSNPPPIPPRRGPPPIPPRRSLSLPTSQSPSVSLLLPWLADGTAPQSGVLKPGKGTRSGIKWQASGPLWVGNRLDQGQCTRFEKECWTAALGGPGVNVDEKGRQRTEILSWPPAKAGGTWVYKWKYHLSSSSLCQRTPCPPGLPAPPPPCPPHRVCSSSKFFHLMQLLSREQGGFIVALSLLNNRIHIGSTLRPQDADDDWKKRLPSIERDKFEGRTTFHRVEVRWGPMGYVRYTVHGLSRSSLPGEDQVPELLIDYRVDGVDVPALGSLKTGLYRAFVPGQDGECSAAFGDFDFFRKT